MTSGSDYRPRASSVDWQKSSARIVMLHVQRMPTQRSREMKPEGNSLWALSLERSRRKLTVRDEGTDWRFDTSAS